LKEREKRMCEGKRKGEREGMRAPNSPYKCFQQNNALCAVS